MFIDALASLAIFAALTIGILAITSRQTADSPEERVRTLATGRLRTRDLPSVSFAERFFAPVGATFWRLVVVLLPTKWLQWVEKKLVVAGRPMSVNAFFAFVLVVATSAPVAYFAGIWAATQGRPGRWLAFIPLLILVGALLPVLWLRRVARRRQLKIWRGLPDAFDLVTTCVEAGLSLDAAFQKVAEKLVGPFGDEVAQMLREVALGKTRRAALTDMAARVDVTDLTIFATAVIQSEQLGTSLAQVLRVQAAQIRVRRRQRAEEVARQAPVKMVFPLVICLMPSLFIVIAGPVVMRLRDVLSSH